MTQLAVDNLLAGLTDKYNLPKPIPEWKEFIEKKKRCGGVEGNITSVSTSSCASASESKSSCTEIETVVKSQVERLEQQENALKHYLPLDPTLKILMHEEYHKLDPDSTKWMNFLAASSATEIWHKHSTFVQHLRGVWKILQMWKQPEEICRLGLFHSAYSNSFVAMSIFEGDPDILPNETKTNSNTKPPRLQLQETIGITSEALVYGFCVIDREDFERIILTEKKIPESGMLMKHIRSKQLVRKWLDEGKIRVVSNPDLDLPPAFKFSNEYLKLLEEQSSHVYTWELKYDEMEEELDSDDRLPSLYLNLPKKTCGQYLLHTIADYLDQFFNWQELMELGHPEALWPSNGLPMCRLFIMMRMAQISVTYGDLQVVPEIFRIAVDCDTNNKLPAENELRARDLYWKAITLDVERVKRYHGGVSRDDVDGGNGEVVKNTLGQADGVDPELNSATDTSENRSKDREEIFSLLVQASKYNPYVGEPYILKAQLLCQDGQWEECKDAAKEGLKWLQLWGTNWDKRVAYEGWICWARCVYLGFALVVVDFEIF